MVTDKPIISFWGESSNSNLKCILAKSSHLMDWEWAHGPRVANSGWLAGKWWGDLWPKTVPRKAITIKWVNHRFYLWHVSRNKGKCQSIGSREIKRYRKRSRECKNNGETLLQSAMESCHLRVDQMSWCLRSWITAIPFFLWDSFLLH